MLYLIHVINVKQLLLVQYTIHAIQVIAVICNVCNNKKSFAYMTSGGNNCNNSIFYNIFYNIEYIGDNINPIVAKIYNHRKEIFDITCSTIIVYGLLLFFNQ